MPGPVFLSWTKFYVHWKLDNGTWNTYHGYKYIANTKMSANVRMYEFVDDNGHIRVVVTPRDGTIEFKSSPSVDARGHYYTVQVTVFVWSHVH